MRHRAARRRLPQLLDHTLAPETERAVRAHVGQCHDCRERLAEFEACGRLLERLPTSLIPLAPTPAGEQRLVGLARWSPAPARGEGPETAALAVAAAALEMRGSGPATRPPGCWARSRRAHTVGSGVRPARVAEKATRAGSWRRRSSRSGSAASALGASTTTRPAPRTASWGTWNRTRQGRSRTNPAARSRKG